MKREKNMLMLAHNNGWWRAVWLKARLPLLAGLLVGLTTLLSPATAVQAANMTPNSGFENVCVGNIPCNWGNPLGFSGVTIASSGTAHSGSHSLSLSATISGGSAQSDCFPISAGSYDISFWYKTSSTNMVALQGGIYMYSAPACAGGAGNTAAFATPLRTDGTWSNVKGTLSPLPGTVSVRAEFFFHCGGTIFVTPCSPALTALFDDVCFAPAGECAFTTVFLPVIMR